MALLQDLEPPSSKTNENKNSKYQIGLIPKFKSLLLNFRDKVIFFIKEIFTMSLLVVEFVKNGRYFPHFALILLSFIITATNLNQKIAAKAYYSDIIAINSDTEYSVADTVDQYTPLIKSDSTYVEKLIVASSVSDGFASSNGTISTLVTSREDPAALAAIDNTNKTITYTVANGDTLSGLGMTFDVKIASIKYVNNIDNENLLKPGAKIKIPPKNYIVPQSLIAKQEKARLAAASRNTVVRNSSSSRASGRAKSVNYKPGSKSNGYPYGWCTYFVATKRYVPSSWGNAKNWLNSARRAGYSTGGSPVPGSIMVTSESGYGHVAYVESVNGNNITVSEMNYEGWGVASRRTLSSSAGFIRGFIY